MFPEIKFERIFFAVAAVISVLLLIIGALAGGWLGLGISAVLQVAAVIYLYRKL